MTRGNPEAGNDRSGKHPCPQCGSKAVLTILYGLPAGEAVEEAKRGEIALGGCCISDDMPRWHCSHCAHRWGRIHDSYEGSR